MRAFAFTILLVAICTVAVAATNEATSSSKNRLRGQAKRDDSYPVLTTLRGYLHRMLQGEADFAPIQANPIVEAAEDEEEEDEEEDEDEDKEDNDRDEEKQEEEEEEEEEEDDDDEEGGNSNGTPALPSWTCPPGQFAKLNFETNEYFCLGGGAREDDDRRR